MALARRTLAIAAAFAAVYVIWGSTYLAIRIVVDEMPPFLMASARWLVAGAILYAWRRMAGDAAPTPRQWLTAGIVGTALVLGGNGLVSWAEIYVPSGLTALLIAIVPVWIALAMWLRHGDRPAGRALAGIVVGLAGVAALVLPTFAASDAGFGPLALGSVVILLASLSWATGSVYARTAPQPTSALLGAAMQMLAGSLALGIVGTAAGEWARVDLAAVSVKAWGAFVFLAIFGSVVAYSAYVWLLRVVRPEKVATYAFVNPIVAVILGVAFAGETLGPSTWLAAALIVVGVALVVTAGKSRAPRREDPKVAEGDAS